MIGETFCRDVSQDEIDDPDLSKYINNILITKTKPKDTSMDAMMGRGVGLQIEDPTDFNRDPFASLRPNRSMF